MATLGKRTSRYWIVLALSLFLAGFLILPIVAYYAGTTLAGPYEGPFGILGFLIELYAASWAGNWAAATLLATPAIILVIWIAAFRLRRFLAH